MEEWIPIDKRNLVYKKAKDLYIERIKFIERIKLNGNPECGLCWAIREATFLMGYGLYSVKSNEFKKLFPELMKCKPEDAKDNEFWWETKNTKVRLECFSFMIEETEKK